MPVHAKDKDPELKLYMQKTYVSAHPGDPALLQALLIQMVAKANEKPEKKRRSRRGSK